VWAGQVFGGEPCCDPGTKGSWSDPINSDAMGIHSSLLNTGKVLFFGFDNAGEGFLADPQSGDRANGIYGQLANRMLSARATPFSMTAGSG